MSSKFSFWKFLFCKHDFEDVEAHAYLNGQHCSTRRMKICKKCDATSAMVKLCG